MTKVPTFKTKTLTKHGRIGELHLWRNNKKLRVLSTPILYPVVSFMTGTSPRGGGIWKYLLRNFAPREIPMLSQVLHFLDFNLTSKHTEYWREKPMQERYQEVDMFHESPLFLDSGGFKLLYNADLNLSEYGIHKETEAEDILAFQRDCGGDIIASLDYPLPPTLVRNEAETRMGQSLQNAFRVAEQLSELSEPPYLYICCHGQSKADIQNYVTQVFERVKGMLPSFGLAVGSLVPLRGVDDSAVLSRIHGVLEGIPDSERENTPIHAFGVSGNLMPILSYLGVDSFDSTSYIQSARNLGYSHPETHKKLKIMELDSMECTCCICEKTSLEEMQQAFMEDISYRRTSTGKYKSEYYAAIALHNFEMESETLAQMKMAIEADEPLEALVRQISSSTRAIQGVINWLTENDTEFAKRIARTVISVGKKKSLQEDPNQLELFSYRTEHQETMVLREETPTVSLNYTPDSFRIPADYQPPDEKEILLTIPCAGKKPYSLSRTHTIVNTKLQTAFGEKQRVIHKITLSGLYGPVPEEFESEDALTRYEFQLSPQNLSQIELCANRFNDYLDKYGEHYKLIVGYVTSRAYRQVFERVQKRQRDFILLPANPKYKRLSEFFRHIHLDTLVEVLLTVLEEEE